MNKRAVTILSLLLALVLLAGCALPSGSLGAPLEDLLGQITERAGREHNPDGVMFADMHYARPDTDKLAADVRAVEDALESGASLSEVEELLDACMDGYSTFSTMYSLADIFNSRDLRDEYYAAEFEWISAARAEVLRIFDEMYYACAGSELGAELEDDYFWAGFCEEYADPEDSYYNDETVALMQRESELLGRYRELVADPTVEYMGEERSCYELLEELANFDDYAGYIRYLSVLMSYYHKYNEPLAEVYLDLMRVRSELAEKMGFSSCAEMEYLFSFDRDYTPAEAAVFLDEVKEYIVPLYEWTLKEGMGGMLDYAPLSEQELYDGLREVASRLGGECVDAFAFMDRYGLCDIERSIYKADTCFQIYLSDYDAPFIFLSPQGNSLDLIKFIHEFGHFTDTYSNFDASESLDLAEVYSQALELLSLSRLDGILSAREIEKLRTDALVNALDTYATQCAFSAFESRAHALGPDALDAQKLNELFLQSLQEFGACPEGLEEVYQYYWIEIPHLFEFPFYVISYPVSLGAALQIYELELQQEGLGLEKYFEMMPRDYEGLIASLRGVSLHSPLDEGATASVAAMIADELGYKGALAAA